MDEEWELKNGDSTMETILCSTLIIKEKRNVEMWLVDMEASRKMILK